MVKEEIIYQKTDEIAKLDIKFSGNCNTKFSGGFSIAKLNITFSYTRSLNRAFWTYSGQLVVTTACHYVMVEILYLHHTVAWFVNTCIFGYLNFLLIRWIAFPPELDQGYISKKDSNQSN